MFNPTELLGSLMQRGMTGSSGRRVEHSLGNQGTGGAGDILGQILGGGGGASGGSGNMLDMLTKMAGSMAGGGSQAGRGAPLEMGRGGVPGGMSSGGAGSAGSGMLGNLASVLFGGSGGSGGSSRSAMGTGSMAVLGGLAFNALRKAMSGGPADASTIDAVQKIDIDDATSLIAGLRKPASTQEEQQVQDMATLTLRAMINAAKADGTIDEQETQRIVGKLKEDGVTTDEQRFVIEEMRKPLDIDSIVRAVPNQQAGAQLYVASLLAIEVDTEAEKRYMQDLAARLHLDNNVVRHLHSSVGMA